MTSHIPQRMTFWKMKSLEEADMTDIHLAELTSRGCLLLDLAELIDELNDDEELGESNSGGGSDHCHDGSRAE